MPSLLHIRPRTRGLWMVLCLLAGLTPVVVQADLVSDYFSGLETIQADFVQTVVDSDGETVQDSAIEESTNTAKKRRYHYCWKYHSTRRLQNSIPVESHSLQKCLSGKKNF